MTLKMDDLCIVKTWVDASFAVHDDMKSHTGGLITMGRGAFYASSKKQKMNTKSSTEAELVGAGDFLPQTIWTTNFLKHMGYTVGESRFYQDNTSTMKLERNGRQSSSARTRHINIKYFFIKDRIDNQEIDLIYCRTDQMVADFLSKPQQGAMFRRFRDVIMGKADETSLIPMDDPIKERVGNGVLEPSSGAPKSSWADVVRSS